MSLFFSRNTLSYASWGLLFLNSVVLGLTVTTTNDANVLAAAALLTDSSLTLNTAVYDGGTLAAGTYIEGPLGIPDGIILGSGHVSDATNPAQLDSPSSSNGAPGSTLCDAIQSGGSYDAAVLTLSVTSTAAIDGISFSLIFATSEYPTYVGSSFSDTFVIYVDGVQVAKDSNNEPIRLNGGFFASGSVIKPPASGTTYGGSTPLLQGSAPLAPGPHLIQIAICDIGDNSLDSAALLQLQGCVGDCSIGLVVEPPAEPSIFTGSSTEFTSQPSTSSIPEEAAATTQTSETETIIASTTGFTSLPSTSSIPEDSIATTQMPETETVIASATDSGLVLSTNSIPGEATATTQTPEIEMLIATTQKLETDTTIASATDLGLMLSRSSITEEAVATTQIPEIEPIIASATDLGLILSRSSITEEATAEPKTGSDMTVALATGLVVVPSTSAIPEVAKGTTQALEPEPPSSSVLNNLPSKTTESVSTSILLPGPVVIGIEIVIIVEYLIDVVISLGSTTTKTSSIASTTTNPIYNTIVPGSPCYVCALEKQGNSCPKESTLTVFTTIFPSSALASPIPAVYKLCSTCHTTTLLDVPHPGTSNNLSNGAAKQTPVTFESDHGNFWVSSASDSVTQMPTTPVTVNSSGSEESASNSVTPMPTKPVIFNSSVSEGSPRKGGKLWVLIGCLTFSILCCSSASSLL